MAGISSSRSSVAGVSSYVLVHSTWWMVFGVDGDGDLGPRIVVSSSSVSCRITVRLHSPWSGVLLRFGDV